MKIQHCYCVAALALSLLSQAALAGDAEITLKATQESPQAIKYGPVITIKPKGINLESQAVDSNLSSAVTRSSGASTTAAHSMATKIKSQPLKKIEPEEIDRK